MTDEMRNSFRFTQLFSLVGKEKTPFSYVMFPFLMMDEKCNSRFLMIYELLMQ